MARNLDGVSDYMQGSNVRNVPFTMAIWFNPNAVTATLTLCSLCTGGVSDQSRFLLNCHGALAGDPLRASTVNSSGTSSFAATSTASVAGSWQHGCGVFGSASSRAVYLNGGGKGTESTSRAISNSAVVIAGAQQTTSGVYTSQFDGLLAHFTIWNVALTDAEVALIAKPGFDSTRMRPNAIIGHWPLIGRVSPEIDIRGGANLTLSGSPGAGDHPRFCQELW
ncbi:LamG domain-containing protein [Anatilimnocola floriformis]|uniref:LamG domain-containing protein n=1 Tax=Anatilimnocola floriformis TaxID=2948575 RepID=UPI0020C3E9F0|nr:LamG domain-containing protein [Anatilimnocola floriformis]